MPTRVARGTQGATLDASNTPITISVNAGTGANRYAVVFAYWRNNQNHTIGAPTFNGDAFTQRADLETGTQYRFRTWTLLAPDAGTNDLVLTPTGGTGTAAFCVVGYWFVQDADGAAFEADLATYFATGSNNAAGASFVSSQAVGGISGGLGLFVAGMRDATAARTATAGDLVGVLDQATNSAQGAMAQGDWTSDGGTDTPTMTWDNDGSDLERRFALVLPNAAPAGPTITTQPTAQTVILSNGSSASFTVAATGTGSLSYQWQRDTGSGFSDITGATSATLNLTGIVIGDNGTDYRCNVTDSNGTTASASANLAVYRGPRIATAFGATDSNGESVGAIETDFPNSLRAGSFIRIVDASGARTSRLGTTP